MTIIRLQRQNGGFSHKLNQACPYGQTWQYIFIFRIQTPLTYSKKSQTFTKSFPILQNELFMTLEENRKIEFKLFSYKFLIFRGLKQKNNEPPTPERPGKGTKTRGRDVCHQLKVTLEEMFNGTQKKLALNRKELCQDCEGAGGSVRFLKILF